MGRPKGSKNHVKKQPGAQTALPAVSLSKPIEYSFDLPAITLLADTCYNIRKLVEGVAVAKSEVKKCIARSTMFAALESLGLSSFISGDLYVPDVASNS